MQAAVSGSGDVAAPATRRLTLNGSVPVGIAPSGRILLARPDDPHFRADGALLVLQWIQHLRRTMSPPVPTAPR